METTFLASSFHLLVSKSRYDTVFVDKQSAELLRNPRLERGYLRGRPTNSFSRKDPDQQSEYIDFWLPFTP